MEERNKSTLVNVSTSNRKVNGHLVGFENISNSKQNRFECEIVSNKNQYINKSNHINYLNKENDEPNNSYNDGDLL